MKNSTSSYYRYIAGVAWAKNQHGRALKLEKIAARLESKERIGMDSVSHLEF